MAKILLGTTALILLLIGCGPKGPEKWTAYIYPDKSNDKRSMVIGEFKSLEQCQEASKNKLSELQLETRGFYKCGLNCAYHEGMKTEICEKMVK